MSTNTATLAEQALANLVKQFARPLDFLRELVQNAIDAGSPRVEIWLQHVDDVMEIHVDDFGEGMDEAIINEQLTRLFASSKEDDLTKIGKFGIGFTSIFAIEPEAVLLRTGRYGESWELLFHPDRSFDKIRLQEPVQGTQITLFKRMPAEEVERFSRECRWILGFWCEHSNTPVTFQLRSGGDGGASLDSDDPFAAFGDVAPVETVNQPMGIDAPLQVEIERGQVRAALGYGAEPRYGFYNGGLTLLNTRNPDCLGVYAEELGHLQFKVKSDALEHTLTRDNVLQDEHWQQAMEVLREGALALRRLLLEKTVEACVRGDPLGDLHRRLAVECRVAAFHGSVDDWREKVLIRDHRGQPRPIGAVEAVEQSCGAVAIDPGDGPLRRALEAEGVLMVEDAPETWDLLRASYQRPLFGPKLRQVSRADRIFVLPQLMDREELPQAERRLLDTCAALIRVGVGRRIQIRVGDFGGGGERALALEGPESGGVFRRPGIPWIRLPGIFLERCMLINRHHPHYRATLVASGEDLELAALGLAQALLHLEGLEGERVYRRMFDTLKLRILDPASAPKLLEER